jgi:hypothetical protein
VHSDAFRGWIVGCGRRILSPTCGAEWRFRRRRDSPPTRVQLECSITAPWRKVWVFYPAPPVLGGFFMERKGRQMMNDERGMMNELPPTASVLVTNTDRCGQIRTDGGRMMTIKFDRFPVLLRRKPEFATPIRPLKNFFTPTMTNETPKHFMSRAEAQRRKGGGLNQNLCGFAPLR